MASIATTQDITATSVPPVAAGSGTIGVPVSFWPGRDDMNVPVTHSRWVAAQVPDAGLHLRNGTRHLSIMTQPVGRMLVELTAHR